MAGIDCVETTQALRAPSYARPLKYTTEGAGRPGAFRYVFDQGEIHCARPALRADRMCYVPKDVLTNIARPSPSFVYLDVGCWADNADGKGTRRRSFGLVCGPHVYLCELMGGAHVPPTGVPAVRELLAGLAAQGRAARIVKYVRAREVTPATAQDTDLYVLLGDLHMPPVTWFYSRREVVAPPPAPMPDWLASVPAMARQKDDLMRSYFQRSAYDQAAGKVQYGLGFANAEADIFGDAGNDLVLFLDALAALEPNVRTRLHVIQVGDMFELWAGRGYEMSPGPDGVPRWRSAASPDRVADWALEVMLQNSSVFPAWQRLEAGLREVKYLYGNHDNYLMKEEVPRQLGIPPRTRDYRGLHDDLLVEHGHRFDSANFDNTKPWRGTGGPLLTFLAFNLQPIRSLEPIAHVAAGLTNPAARDIYLLGAALRHLHERFELGKKPFSIFAMAHTHEPTLLRFEVRTTYTTKDQEIATKGFILP